MKNEKRYEIMGQGVVDVYPSRVHGGPCAPIATLSGEFVNLYDLLTGLEPQPLRVRSVLLALCGASVLVGTGCALFWFFTPTLPFEYRFVATCLIAVVCALLTIQWCNWWYGGNYVIAYEARADTVVHALQRTHGYSSVRSLLVVLTHASDRGRACMASRMLRRYFHG